MQKGKIKPSATVVAQFAAGVEIEAIQHEGRIFLPVISLGEFAAEEPENKPTPKAPETPTEPKGGKKSAPAPESSTKAASKTYTEDELMKMESKDLEKILRNDFGVNPDDFEGKNTNKKLRKLILDAQANEAKTGGEAEEENDETPEVDEELLNNIREILKDFDAGKKNKKKTIAAITALGEDFSDEELAKVKELIEEFESNEDADTDEIATKLAVIFSDGESDDDDEDELVDADDLEVGDKVSVFWADDNNDWFDGEVKSIKKGKILIAYDDDSEEYLDSEVHTKIRRRK